MDVRRAGDRVATRTGWLDSRHSFSFGSHYDSTDTGFGLLVVNNDDVVEPGTGFDTHAHRDMEIVTWVLSGSLVHQDSTGHRGLIYPGLAQRMSAGTGIRHCERNDSWRCGAASGPGEPVHFVQMWVLPDEPSVPPGYEQREVEAEALAGCWATLASGLPRDTGHSATRIRQRGAALHAARLQPGQPLTVPAAPYLHLYVAAGAVDLEGTGRLDTGDAARIRAAGGQRLVAASPSELLAWEMHSGPKR